MKTANSTLTPKPTQCQRIYDELEKRRGEWINGRYFIKTMMISQAHARIKELETKGVKIEHSDFRDEYGFVSYRLPSDKLF